MKTKDPLATVIRDAIVNCVEPSLMAEHVYCAVISFLERADGISVKDAERSVWLLYLRQTDEERASGQTLVANGRGVSASDAAAVARIARGLLVDGNAGKPPGERLRKADTERAFDVARRYRRQVAELGPPKTKDYLDENGDSQ